MNINVCKEKISAEPGFKVFGSIMAIKTIKCFTLKGYKEAEIHPKYKFQQVSFLT